MTLALGACLPEGEGGRRRERDRDGDLFGERCVCGEKGNSNYDYDDQMVNRIGRKRETLDSRKRLILVFSGIGKLNLRCFFFLFY